MILSFFTGMLIGLMIAVPVGPIDLLCVRRSLMHGMRSGFITGWGAAFADALYAAIAAFGVTELSTYLMDNKIILQIFGGIFLCILGYKSFFYHEVQEIEEKTQRTYAFLTTFFLALTSPMTIVSFVGAYAALGIGTTHEQNFPLATMFTFGVFFGSTLWWFVLSSGVTLYKHRLQLRHLHWLNRFSGILLVSFGFIAIGFTLTGYLH